MCASNMSAPTAVSPCPCRGCGRPGRGAVVPAAPLLGPTRGPPLHLLLQLLLLLLLAAVSSCSGCPAACLCATQTVKCLLHHGQGLDSMPRPLPANTKSLFVTGYSIYNLSPDSFPTRLEQLTDLHLSGNEITSVHSMVFDNLPNLVQLDLSDNTILHFNETAFPVNNVLQVLNLSSVFHNHTTIGVLLGVLRSGVLLHLTTLDLSDNGFVVFPDGMFDGLSKLTSLILRNGSLVALQNGTLPVTLLRELDLRDNSLRELPNATLAKFSQKSGLRVLRLSGNPWRCDCFLEDMVVWLKGPAATRLVQDRQNLTCVEPAALRSTPLLRLEPARLECDYSNDMQGVLETSYVFLGLVLALIGVIFLLVLYLNRRGIKRWMYNIRDACRDHMEGYHYRYEINSDPRLANLSINSDV